MYAPSGGPPSWTFFSAREGLRAAALGGRWIGGGLEPSWTTRISRPEWSLPRRKRTTLGLNSLEHHRRNPK